MGRHIYEVVVVQSDGGKYNIKHEVTPLLPLSQLSLWLLHNFQDTQ